MKILTTLIIAILLSSCDRRVIQVEREEWILKKITIREQPYNICCILLWVNRDGTEFTEFATPKDTIALQVGSGVLNRTIR